MGERKVDDRELGKVAGGGPLPKGTPVRPGQGSGGSGGVGNTGLDTDNTGSGGDSGMGPG